MAHRRSAFTRIELLVVIVLACMLATLLLPAVHKIREELARSHSQSNVEQASPTQRSSPSDYNHLPEGSTPASGPL
jgi:type II secretory pathway pseudopilin PulG